MQNKFIIREIADKDYCSSYLLSIDGYNILINCGTDHLLNPHYLIKDFTVNTILLTCSELSAIGNLPRLSKINTTIYSTIPVKEIGELMLKDHSSVLRDRNYPSYTEKEVEDTFEKIITLKYSQRIKLDNDIEIVGYNSGNSLGGTAWKITKNSEQILIGFNLNHRKENHLDGFDFEEFKHLNFTIIDSPYASKTHILRKDRDNTLIEAINDKIQKGNNVLIITKYSRIIELLTVLIENQNINFKQHKLAVIGKSVKKFHEIIKTHLEYTGENIMNKFSKTKENPFLFNNINFTETFKEIGEDTKIYITVDNEILSDFSIKLIYEISKDNNNKIILTESKYENIIEIKNEDKESVKRIKLSTNNLEENKSFGLNNPDYLNFIENLCNEKLKVNLPQFETIRIQEVKEQEYFKIEEESTSSIEIEESVTKFLPPYNEYNTDINYYVFPIIKPKKRDEYGEFIEIRKENNTKENIEEEIERKYIEKESVEYNPTTINNNIDIQVIDFDGISDIESIVTILESIKINKLIYTGSNKKFIYYYHLFKNKKTTDIFCLENTLSFEFEQLTRIHPILSLPTTTTLLNYSVAYVKGRIEDNILQLSAQEGKCSLGKLKLHDLKRKFIENNFNVEIEDNKIIIEEQIEIMKDNNKIKITGEMNEMYDVVKSIIDKYTIYL